ncbi:hypothetical protein DH2020_000941 [Rehmannia glutinosa]|uniref:Threonylcarbamoyl-AMP synthase n=1 Tax=Rehmannia glutinosa TaxID=99300 RepID=A0ABR0XXX4_REHGL
MDDNWSPVTWTDSAANRASKFATGILIVTGVEGTPDMVTPSPPPDGVASAPGLSLGAVIARRIAPFICLRYAESTSPLLSSLSVEVQKLQFLNTLRSRREFFAKTMTWNLEKCDGHSGEDAKMGLLRPATEDYAAEAIEAVRSGKVIAVPTDTLYGFACDACSVEAVHRIYEIKGRKYTSPLAICVGDVFDIKRFAVTDHLPHGLLNALLPGPVTVVLRRGSGVKYPREIFKPRLDSIGVRVPDCNFIRVIARGSGSALALTSANLSGQPSSVDVRDFENLWHHCAYVYDGGALPSGRAGSTVVDLSMLGKYKILRPGSAKEETVAILERHALVEDGNAS